MEPQRRGRGRPPKPEGERRERVLVALYLTPSEIAAVEAARGEADMGPWVREVILAAARTS